jgi:hypothetical protein
LNNSTLLALLLPTNIHPSSIAMITDKEVSAKNLNLTSVHQSPTNYLNSGGNTGLPVCDNSLR